MAKKLNKNLVAALGIVGFVLTTVVGVLMVSQLKETDPQEFVRRAEEEAAKKDYTRAAAFYGQAYAVGQDAQYLVLKADMLYELGKEVDALKAYRQAVVIDPNLLRAHEQILNVNLEMIKIGMRKTESWRSVKEASEEILERQGNHPRAVYGLGVAYLGLKELDPGNEAKGVEYLKQAVELAPDDPDPTRELASYYNETGRPVDAEEVLRDLVAATTEPGRAAATARCALARFLSREDKHDEIEGIFEDALRLAGDDPEVQSLVQVRRGRYWYDRWVADLRKSFAGISLPDGEMETYAANAEAALRKATEIQPESFDGYLYLAELLKQSDRADEAIEVYEARLALPFDRRGLNALLVKLNRYKLLLGLADLYANLASREPSGSERLKELATEADMRVEEALRELPTGPEASLARGRIKAVLGKHREAVKWYERAVDQSTRRQNWQTQYFLAQSLLELRETGRAREAILKAVAAPDAPVPCWLTLARIELEMGQAQAAIVITNQVLAKAPSNRDALIIKAAAQDSLGQRETAQKTINQITDATPPIIAAKIQLLANEDRTEEAIELAETSLKQAPANPNLVRAAAGLYKTIDRPEDAQRVVDAALAADPDNFDLKLLALQITDIEPGERRSQYVAMLNEIEDPFERSIRLASYYGSEGDTDNQLTQLNTAKDLIIASETQSARNAGETSLRSIVDALFQIHASRGNLEALDKLVEEATAANLDAADGLSYEGRRLMVDGLNATQEARKAFAEDRKEDGERLAAESTDAYKKAIESLNMALEQYPSSGHTYAQLGEAYLQTNRIDEARIAFERAMDILPRNGLVLKRLAAIANSSGDRAQFERYLKECKKLMPNDPWVLDQFLVIDQDTDPRAVIAQREQKREDAPDDIGNLYVLAELYYKVGDIGLAQERINDILTQRSDTWVVGGLAKLLRKMNANDRALAILQDHLRNAPDDEKASAQLLVAEHAAELRLAAADAEYLAAADIDPNQKVCVAIGRHFLVTGRSAEAGTWLQKAYDKAVESDSIEKAAIQRLQIEAAIRSEDMPVASRLAKQYASDYPEDPTSLFLEAQVASGMGRSEEAVQKLTRFLEERPGHPLGVYRRARYLGSLGRWRQAIPDLEELRATNPDALDYAPRSLLAKAYTQVGQLDEAIRELEDVFHEDQSVIPVIRDLLDLYFAHDRFAAADEVLATLLNKEPDNPAWLLRSAEVAVKQNDRGKALTSYKQASKLAGYPPNITVPFINACRKGELDAVEQGIAYVEETIPPNMRSPQVMLAYANLLADRGDNDTAIETYLLAVHRAGYGVSGIQEQVANAALSSLGADAAIIAFSAKPADELFERASQLVLSEAYQQTGKFEQCKEICESLLETAEDDPSRAAILSRLALVDSMTGESQQSKSRYEEVLKLDPDNIVALNNLAYLLADELGQAKEAVPYAERAAELSPIADVIDTLGYVYLQAGRNRDAIAQFTKVREADPTAIPATTHLAEALRREGEFDSAIELFDIVLSMQTTGPYAQFRTEAEEGKRKARDRSAD